MSKSISAVALIVAAAFGAAQAQAPSAQNSRNPSVALQTTAPAGADARKLLGRTVRNAQNDTIGEIKSIHLDPNGTVDGVIVAVGGFLGMGEREVLLGWRDLQIDANGEIVKANMTKDQLKSMPAYTYTDPSLRGTVFTDKGVWMPDQTAGTTVPTRSTGDFNIAGNMSTAALLGKTVKNVTNESVGKVEDVYVDASGAVKLVVVSVGGFLGVGSKSVGVPWTDLKFGRDGSAITVMTNWTRDSLKAMPDYNDERRLPTGTVRSGG